MAIYPVPAPDSSLVAIQNKVRRLTRSPSESQLTDDQLNDYINTFVLYDFPSILRLFSLRTRLTFYTQPNVDTYQTNTTNVNDPLYQFDNKYITVHPSFYVAGVQCFSTQKVDIFYGNYPQIDTTIDTGLRGNGTAGPFTGTLTQQPALQNSIVFSALDANGTAMILVDYPQNNTSGFLGIVNQANILTAPYGTINYITGAFTFNFPAATLNDVTNIVYSTAYYYIPGLPLAILYYANQFIIRPVPDKVYPIEFEVDMRPTQLFLTTSVPQIAQWWQFIAVGTAIKILQDRVDFETVQTLMPLFREQLNFVNRTNIDQYANERTTTIYTQGKNNFGWSWFSNSWPF